MRVRVDFWAGDLGLCLAGWKGRFAVGFFLTFRPTRRNRFPRLNFLRRVLWFFAAGFLTDIPTDAEESLSSLEFFAAGFVVFCGWFFN
jgi:hypothetical protein